MEEPATDSSDVKIAVLDFEAVTQDTKQAFSDVCKFGDETLILSIDLDQKCTTYFGTPHGQEFIRKRKELLEEFYNFCYNAYSECKRKEDKRTTEKTNQTTHNDRDDLSELTIDLGKTNDVTVESLSVASTGSGKDNITTESNTENVRDLDPTTNGSKELTTEEDSKQIEQCVDQKKILSNSSKKENDKNDLKGVPLEEETPKKETKANLRNSKRVTRSGAKTPVKRNEGKSKISSKKLTDSKSLVETETKQVQNKSKCKDEDLQSKTEGTNSNKKRNNKIEKEIVSQISTPERSTRKRQIKTPSWIQSYVVDGINSKKKNENSHENDSSPKTKNKKSNESDLKAKRKIGDSEEIKAKIDDNDDEIDDDNDDLDGDEESEMELDDSDYDADYVPDKNDIQQEEEESEHSDNETNSPKKTPKLSYSKNSTGPSKPRQVSKESSNMNDFKCNKCGMVFSWLKNLNRHLKRIHNTSIEENMQVEKDASDRNKKEENERSFKCHKCTSAYYWKKNLKVHLKKCHDIDLENVKEQTTDKGEGQTDGENVRQRPFKCYTCKKAFYWKRNLISHLKRKHKLRFEDNVRPENYNSEEEDNQSDDNGVGKDIQNQKAKGKFQCDYCKQVFPWKNNLRRHLMTRHGIGREKLRQIFRRITRETGIYAKSRTSWLDTEDVDTSQETPEIQQEKLDSSSWMTVKLDNDKILVEADENEDETIDSEENVKDSNTVEPKRKNGQEFSFGDRSKRPFICKICNLSFKYRSNLWRHARQHSKTNMKKWKFSCPDCDKGFDTELLLKSHLRSAHKKLNLFSCEKCKISMHTITTYRKHVKQCKGEPEMHMLNDLTCSICLQVFKTQRTLDLHMKQHENENPVCRLCGKKFLAPKRLAMHMKVHMKDMKLSCYACDRKFAYPCNLARHLEYVHKDTRPFCKKCSALFETENELEEHLKKEHNIAPNMCRYCGEVIPDPYLLKKHKLMHKPSLVCEICGMTFERNGLLKEHLILHSGQYPLACDMCDKRFQLKMELTKHRINDHGVKKCQCDECGRVFNLPQTLRKHLLTHTSICAYSCKHCPRKFRSTDGLKYHTLAKHKGSDNIEDYKKKVYKCEHCGKIVGQKHVYERHIRMHTGEKPFTCNICRASFPVKARLNQHIKRHYSNKQYGCDVCNLEFWDQGSLKNHLQTRKHKQAERNPENNVMHIVQQPETTVQIAEDQEIEIPMLIDGATKEYHVELVKPEPSEVQEVHQVMYETGEEIEVGVPYQVIQIPSTTPGGEQQYIYIRMPDSQGDTDTTNIIYDVDTNSAVRSILNTQ